MIRQSLLCLSFVLTLHASSALPAHTEHDHDGAASGKIGTVHFSVSCKAEAQAQFDRAVAYLHSFWFEAATEGFAKVAQTDPACAMAHWGSAMTLLGNPFGWPPAARVLPEGLAEVEKAKAADAKSAREKDYIAAIETFYRDHDKLDHRTRAVAYERAMGKIHARHPEDSEAAVFYALALSATALPTDKTYAQPIKAGAILEKVFSEQPDHPGAAHYLTHAYDYPSLAERGLNAARRYAQIAPAAPHALHMPSHVFTRVGLWDESIQSNLASQFAATNQFDKLHAMDYLAYAYLQGAQDEKAKDIIDSIQTIGKISQEHFVVAYALAAIPARHALERGDWATAAKLSLYPTAADYPWTKFPQAEAVNAYARALGAARQGDAAAARKESERLSSLREAMLKAKQDYWAGQAQIQMHAALGWALLAEGKEQEALALLRTAADQEDATDKHPVTPGPLAPAREQLAEMLLQLKKPEQALAEFEASQKTERNRFRSLYGAGQAARQAELSKEARHYFQRLLDLAKDGSKKRKELKTAREFVNRS